MTKAEEPSRNGWVLQGTYGEPRLSEIVAMYEELGFEVRREAYDPREDGACNQCLNVSPEKFKAVYTRKRSS